jgi:hypothetical protein
MHPVAFKKALIEAYLAGASNMYCGCYEIQSRADAKEWFENEYGRQDPEECDCCEEIED